MNKMDHKNMFIWLDGALVPWEQANVHILTHTLHYGSGAFEGIRCYATLHGPAIFRLDEHLDRLLNSFALFAKEIPWSKEQLADAIKEIIKVNGLKECYIRPLLFFGSESILINPEHNSVHCAIIALPMEKYLGNKAVRVTTSPFKRLDSKSVPTDKKITGYYVNSICAVQEARKRGFDEALLCDTSGTIAESSVTNIFFVIDGVLQTPMNNNILPGITRLSIISLSQELGLKIEECSMTQNDIARASEAFFTGTASEITPIHSIDDKQFAPVGAQSVTMRLKQAYNQAVLGNNKQFLHWLTFIN